ncbi:MAG: radical SAM protein [Candidatus Micrarchaeota archaeon]
MNHSANERIGNTNSNAPGIIHLEKSPALVRGLYGIEKPGNRTLLLIYPKRSCSYAIKNKPCTYCGFWKREPKTEGLMKFEDAAKQIKDGDRIEYLLGGSMLDRAQVNILGLMSSFRVLASTGAECILLETRPEYISEKEISYFKRRLGDKTLEIAVGLETTNDQLRAKLNKGYDLRDVEEAFRKIVMAGAYPVTYLLIGLEMSEKEAIEDFRRSVSDLDQMQRRIGAPIRIALETFYPVEKYHKQGKYLTPEFVARVVKEAKLRHDITIFVATSSEGLCSHPLLTAKQNFDSFNLTQDVSHLGRVSSGG